MNEQEKKLYCVAAEVFNIPFEQIGRELAFNSIPEWDSLAHIRLVLRLEQEFGTKFDPEALMAVETLGEFLTLIQG